MKSIKRLKKIIYSGYNNQSSYEPEIIITKEFDDNGKIKEENSNGIISKYKNGKIIHIEKWDKGRKLSTEYNYYANCVIENTFVLEADLRTEYEKVYDSNIEIANKFTYYKDNSKLYKDDKKKVFYTNILISTKKSDYDERNLLVQEVFNDFENKELNYSISYSYDNNRKLNSIEKSFFDHQIIEFFFNSGDLEINVAMTSERGLVVNYNQIITIFSSDSVKDKTVIDLHWKQQDNDSYILYNPEITKYEYSNNFLKTKINYQIGIVTDNKREIDQIKLLEGYKQTELIETMVNLISEDIENLDIIEKYVTEYNTEEYECEEEWLSESPFVPNTLIEYNISFDNFVMEVKAERLSYWMIHNGYIKNRYNLAINPFNRDKLKKELIANSNGNIYNIAEIEYQEVVFNTDTIKTYSLSDSDISKKLYPFSFSEKTVYYISNGKTNFSEELNQNLSFFESQLKNRDFDLTQISYSAVDIEKLLNVYQYYNPDFNLQKVYRDNKNYFEHLLGVFEITEKTEDIFVVFTGDNKLKIITFNDFSSNSIVELLEEALTFIPEKAKIRYNRVFNSRYGEQFILDEKAIDLDENTQKTVSEITEKLNELKKSGQFLAILPYIEYHINQIKKADSKLSNLYIDDDYRIFLPDYNNIEIKLSHLTKSLYFLFLMKGSFGIDELKEFELHLLTIYKHISYQENIDKMTKSVLDLIKNENNEIYTHFSRIKSTFCKVIDKSIAKKYYIVGERNRPKYLRISKKKTNIYDFQEKWFPTENRFSTKAEDFAPRPKIEISEEDAYKYF